MRTTRIGALLACALSVAMAAPDAEARITRIDVHSVQSPAFEGRVFGRVGQYEKLVGVAYGEVDPDDPRNAGIVNLDKATQNARGMVEYDVDVYILKPVDLERGNDTLLYEVVNRGNKALRFNVGAGGGNDPTTAAHAGDGYAMREGYTMVWSGWQGDVMPGNGRLATRFPIPANADGGQITGWIRSEFITSTPTKSVPVSFDRDSRDVRPYPAVEASMGAAKLYRRDGPHATPAEVPRDQWSFGRCPDGVTVTPSAVDVCYPAGFSPDYVYDLVYEARDPMVMGLGFAATRDLVAFLRKDRSAGNPLTIADRKGRRRNPIRYTLGFGSSQSGRFLKDLVYQGFNQSEDGRRVFDGAIPHISGSRKTFTNYAFAQPGRFSTPVEGHMYPGDQFPFTYGTVTDPITGETDGVLERCRAQGVCPKIMHWDSGTEPWAARSSLVVTDSYGERGVKTPKDVRLYYFASTQHGPAGTPSHGICQQLSNPARYQEAQKALLAALRAWVVDGRQPPRSAYPSLKDGTLAPALEIGFPSIPGVRFNGRYNDLFVNDQSVQPPVHVPGTEYTVLLPTVDADGNEVPGIRSTDVQAPLGTYSGWTLRRAGFIEDEPCYLNGQFIPFAVRAADRGADPRLSLEERYGTHAGYVAAVQAAATRLVRARFLLQEDADRLVAEARARNVGLP